MSLRCLRSTPHAEVADTSARRAASAAGRRSPVQLQLRAHQRPALFALQAKEGTLPLPHTVVSAKVCGCVSETRREAKKKGHTPLVACGAHAVGSACTGRQTAKGLIFLIGAHWRKRMNLIHVCSQSRAKTSHQGSKSEISYNNILTDLPGWLAGNFLSLKLEGLSRLLCSLSAIMADDFAYIGFAEAHAASAASAAAADDEFVDLLDGTHLVSFDSADGEGGGGGGGFFSSTSPPKPTGRCGAPGCTLKAGRWCGSCGGQRCRKCTTARPTLRKILEEVKSNDGASDPAFEKKKQKKTTSLFAMGADSSWCIPCAAAEAARLVRARTEQGPGSARVWTGIFASR